MARISAAAPWPFWVLMYERMSKMTNADEIGNFSDAEPLI